MNEKVGIEKNIIKLRENNFDLTQLNSAEFETVLKYAPGIIKAINEMGELGLKSQEKVYGTIEKAIDVYADQLKDPNLSEESREKLNERIERMVEKAIQKDSEFKKWTGTTIGIVIGVATLALAGNNPEVRKATLKLLTKDKSI